MAHQNDSNGRQAGTLSNPVRNHYFYGKLLEARHFRMETQYFNRKRALLNRLVTGYGVVCGLNLIMGDEGDTIIVDPGLAIDKWGREIVVAQPSKPIPIERLPGTPEGEEEWVHPVICYHECESDPAPVLTSECNETGPCAPDAIRERYRIELRPGRMPDPPHECTIHDAVSKQGIRLEQVALWVTEECDPRPKDPCIPLGEIFIPEDGVCHYDDVHVEHRPVVYSNDMLFELIMGLAEEVLQLKRGGSRRR